MSIVIEDDHLYEEAEFVPADLETLSREEIIGRVKEAGIVGMGGAGFPTHVKLSPKNPDYRCHRKLCGMRTVPDL